MESSPQSHQSLEDFDLEKYLRASVGTRPESFDWSDPGPRLDDESLFCLSFMLDIEAHTIIYMRELLSTSVAEDPAITAFLSCWLYEEFSHSRTIAKLLETQGVRIDPQHFVELRRRTPGDRLAQQCARIASILSRHFPAVHMTWGAINELTAVYGYQSLMDRAQHPMVSTVLARIVKDERRHFSFYFNQARIRLQPRAARALTTFALRAFYTPVGLPVRGDPDTRRIHAHLFAEQKGLRTLAQIDATIARLPGLGWFNLMSRYGLAGTPANRATAGVGASDLG
jgi:hypothetical protein